MEMALITGVFIKIDDCYVAYAEEEPSAITEGRTIEEAQHNLVDAYIQLQIARRKRRARKDATEREAAEYEAELERSHGEIIRIPHISVEVPA